MALTTTPWDSAEYLKTEEDIRLYLEACLEEAGDDPAESEDHHVIQSPSTNR